MGSDPDDYILDFTVLPGTETLLFVDYIGLQIWKQSNSPNAPTYVLENSVSVHGSKNWVLHPTAGITLPIISMEDCN